MVPNFPSGHILVPVTSDISFPIRAFCERGKGRIWGGFKGWKIDRKRGGVSFLAASSDIISMDVTGGMLSPQSL